MKKIIILLAAFIFVFAGCARNDAPNLFNEDISTADAVEAVTTQQVPEATATASETESTQSNDENPDLETKMGLIGFEKVSGYYTRRILEEETEYIEMFSFDKETFVRITTNDLEREVFAYNYRSDDFTYIYYFDGEMNAKTIINIGTGAVLEDSGGYAELLTLSAEELKLYFNNLMEVAGLAPDELH